MIHVEACAADQVRELLERAASPRCNPQGRYRLDDILAAGQCFKLVADGKVVGAYVLEPSGPDLWITAAAGAAEGDLTRVIDRAALYQGQQFDHLVFVTARPGLVRKALALGYQCTMRKSLK